MMKYTAPALLRPFFGRHGFLVGETDTLERERRQWWGLCRVAMGEGERFLVDVGVMSSNIITRCHDHVYCPCAALCACDV
jgi:hypothetical protein